MSSPRESLRVLLEAVLATEPSEIDCEQFFDRLAAYVEAGGKDICGDLPEELCRVRQHLAVCPECVEAFDALCKACDCD